MSAAEPEVGEPMVAMPTSRPKPPATPPIGDGPTAPAPKATASPDLATAAAADLAAELSAAGQRLVLVGVTQDGRRFRPSDWAERLAGVMSQYRPGKAGRAPRQAHLGYSPYVVPSERDGDKCVIVDPRLRDIEPLAWAFVLNFARDNGLKSATL